MLADHSLTTGPLGVVPVLVSLAPVLWALTVGVLVALASVFASLIRPRTMGLICRFAWRLKWTVACIALVIGSSFWAVRHWTAREVVRRGNPAEAGDDWPLFHANLARTGVVAESDSPTQATLNWIWKQEGVSIFASPAVVGNRVYLSSAKMSALGGGSGAICCLDADTGSLIWQRSPGCFRATFSSPVIAGDYLVCGEGLHSLEDARIICQTLEPGRAGETLWTLRTESHVECTPVISEGRAYVGAGDDGYYCVELEADANGQAQVVWHVPGEDYPDAETALAVHQGHVYAGLGLGGEALCVLNAATGEELKRIKTDLPVFGPPSISGGKMFVTMGNGDLVHCVEELGESPGGSVWCIDLESLEVEWKFAVDRTALGGVAVLDQRIYFGARDGSIYCVGTDGRLLQQRDTFAPIVTTPAVTNDYVYLINDAGMLYCLDRENLEFQWEFKVGSEPLFISSPAVARGKVYVGTQHDGFLCVGEAGEDSDRISLWSGPRGGAGSGVPDGSPLPELGAFRWQYPAGRMHQPDLALTQACAAVTGDRLVVPMAGHGDRAGIVCLPLGAAKGVGRVKGGRSQLCEAPEGPFRQLTPAPFNPNPLWKCVTTNPVTTSPVIRNGIVYLVDGQAGGDQRRLIAISLDDGRLVWDSPVEPDASGIVRSMAEGVLVQDGATQLSLFTPDGQRMWSQSVGAMAGVPDREASMLVAVAQQPPSLTSMDVLTGRRLWSVDLPQQPTTSPMIAEQRIFLGTRRGLQSRSLLDGSTVNGWRADDEDVRSELCLGEEHIAYGAIGGQVLVRSMHNGSLVHRYDNAVAEHSPIISQGRLLFVGAEGLMTTVLGQADSEPTLWVDTSRLGQPSGEMVLFQSRVFMEYTGRGLVCFGESR